MQHYDIRHDVAAIETALRACPNPTITGGQLFSLMRSVTPALNFREVVRIPKGPGAMTQFVRDYLSNILEKVGNQGGDVLYRVDGREIGESATEASADLWKNFVSPSSPRHLVLECGRQQLVSRLAPASGETDEIEISKATPAEHDQTRASFMQALPSDEAAELSSHIPPGASFTDWIAALRRYSPETVRKWGLFRRDRLYDLLVQRVDKLCLDDTFRVKVITQIRASQHSAYKQQKETKSAASADPAQGPVPTPVHSNDGPLEEARSLTRAAIDLMGYDELRTLKLPLGVVLDALRSRA